MKASKIQELRERRRKIIIAGGEDKIKARHEKGLLTARERLEALFQPETFRKPACISTIAANILEALIKGYLQTR